MLLRPWKLCEDDFIENATWTGIKEKACYSEEQKVPLLTRVRGNNAAAYTKSDTLLD